MGFVQVIEYETERADEIMALGENQRSEMPETPEGFRVTVTRDRDNPNRSQRDIAGILDMIRTLGALVDRPALYA